jgi:hypothetical protein
MRGVMSTARWKYSMAAARLSDLRVGARGLYATDGDGGGGLLGDQVTARVAR